MDWFRWHHGSTNDPKFRLVARYAKAGVGEVIAVWAVVLEAASQSSERGHPGEIDAEAIDCALEFEDGATARILLAMADRGLIDQETGRITAWDRRQPARERVDDSGPRVRAHRERKRMEAETDGDVTPRNAPQRHVTPKPALEEIRVEKKREETVQETPVVCVSPVARASDQPPDDPPRPPDQPPPAREVAAVHTHESVVVEAPPEPVGPDPETSDPVAWLREHGTFARRVRDPALLVSQLRQAAPGLDLVSVFRTAATWLRAGNTPRSGYERLLRSFVLTESQRTVKAHDRATGAAAERKARIAARLAGAGAA